MYVVPAVSPVIVVCAHSPRAANPNQVPPSGETTGVTEEVETYDGIAKQHKSGENPQPDQPAALPPFMPLLAQGAPETDPLVTSCARTKIILKINTSCRTKRMPIKTIIFDKCKEFEREHQYD